MKRWIAMLVLISVLLTGCGRAPQGDTQPQTDMNDPAPTQSHPSQSEPTQPPLPTEPENDGLVFELNEDGASYRVTGLRENHPMELVIPAEYDGKPVTVIDCVNNGDYTSVEIPESVTRIESYAFATCTNLTAVTIPGTVKQIGSNAFLGCEALGSVVICNGVEQIGFMAFGHCGSLTELDLPDDGLVFVDSEAFQASGIYKDPDNWEKGVLYFDNYLLGVDEEAFHAAHTQLPIHYEIREGTVCIAEKAFDSGFYNVKRITLPESLVYIGAQSFVGVYIETLRIPAGVRYIGAQAFSGQYYLEQLQFEEGVQYIGDGAFIGCTNLTSVSFPASVIYIGTEVVSGDHVRQISVKKGNPVYHSDGNCLIETATGRLVQGCNASAIPNDGSVTAIGYRAFASCRDIEDVVIPEGVTVIEEGAFDYCSLKTLSLPQSLERIEKDAFVGDSFLTGLTIPANVSYIGNNAFAGCKRIEKLVFETTDGWLRGGETVDLSDPAAVLALLIEYTDDISWIRGE